MLLSEMLGGIVHANAFHMNMNGNQEFQRFENINNMNMNDNGDVCNAQDQLAIARDY